MIISEYDYLYKCSSFGGSLIWSIHVCVDTTPRRKSAVVVAEQMLLTVNLRSVNKSFPNNLISIILH